MVLSTDVIALAAFERGYDPFHECHAEPSARRGRQTKVIPSRQWFRAAIAGVRLVIDLPPR